MKRLIAAVLTLTLCAPALAQTTKSGLNASINSSFPDNTVGAITPLILRTWLQSAVSSWQQAPQVRTNVTTSDTILLSDYGNVVTESNASPVAVTLPQATGSFATFNYFQKNNGSGLLTITPVTSTINGSSTYTLTTGQSAFIVSDGTNWQVVAGVATIPDGSITNAKLAAGTFSNITGTGALTAGSTGAGFTINLGSSTITGAIPSANVSGSYTGITTLGSVAFTTLTGTTVTGLANCANSSDACNKAYVDAATTGVTFHPTVVVATTGVLSGTPTYSNGTAGVGATITATTNGALTVDGHAVANGERVLVKDQSSTTGCTVANVGCQNGVYTQTTLGNGGTPYALTRATDMDTVGTGPTKMETNAVFLVTAGSTNVGASFALTTLPVITIGTTGLTFSQNGASQIYTAGTGLTLAGSAFSLTTPVSIANGGTNATSFVAGLVTTNGSSLTGLAGNAGGVPCFPTVGTVSSSATLTTYGVVLGGGSGSCLVPSNRMTDAQFLIGQTAGPPVAATITGPITIDDTGVSTITNNAVTNSKLATASAATFKGNATSGTTNVTDISIPALSLATPSPSLDFLFFYEHVSGTFLRTTPALIAAAATAGVSSIASQTGAFTCPTGGGVVCASNALSGSYVPITAYGAVSGGSTTVNNAAVVSAESATLNLYYVPYGTFTTTKNFLGGADVTQQYSGPGHFVDASSNQRGKWWSPWSHQAGQNTNAIDPTVPATWYNGDWSQSAINIEQQITAPLIYTTSMVTSAPTASGNVLHFASPPSPLLLQNSSTVVVDATTPGLISLCTTSVTGCTTVVGISGNDVTLSQNVLAGVGAGDTITFGVGQYMQPQQAASIVVQSFAANNTLNSGQVAQAGQYLSLGGQNVSQTYMSAVNDAGGGGFANHFATCRITRGPGGYYSSSAPFNTASCGILGGVVDATVANVYLDPIEFVMRDNGHSLTANGFVMDTERKATGDQTRAWRGFYVQSGCSGCVEIDSAFSLTGPANWGIDFTGAAIASSNGAIAMKVTQRIYFGATSGGSYPSSPGGESIYSSAAGSLNFEAAGADMIKIHAAGLAAYNSTPTMGAGTCGSGGGNFLVSGSTNNAGQVQVGATATACSITFSTPFPANVFCTANNNTRSAALQVQTGGSSGFTVLGLTAGDEFSWVCM